MTVSNNIYKIIYIHDKLFNRFIIPVKVHVHCTVLLSLSFSAKVVKP